jgi:hypothetical protein
MLDVPGWFATKTNFFAQPKHQKQLDRPCLESRFGRFTCLELDFLLLNPAWGLLLLAGLPRILCI